VQGECHASNTLSRRTAIIAVEVVQGTTTSSQRRHERALEPQVFTHGETRRRGRCHRGPRLAHAASVSNGSRRPAAKSLKWSRLKENALECRRCDLWKRGTQTVFGAGPVSAKVIMVGEQPGDQEDLAGEPFVGPAGRLLREAIAEAGGKVASVYLTNAVKHFKWQERGKRRIHERPNREEILACRMWLDSEIAIIKPKLIIALGSTAAAALLGSSVRVMRDRGKWFPTPEGANVAVTVHPSSVLRAPDAVARQQSRKAFVDDLRAMFQRLEVTS
jgi:uracil-DNA glycosylase